MPTNPGQVCPFCAIIRGDAPARFITQWPDVLAIEPLHPVVDGHTLVLPTRHVRDAAEDPDVTAATMRCAAELAGSWSRPFNIITSAGVAATQSVFHLHLHVVPRAVDDGLALPWYSGKRTKQRISNPIPMEPS